jgi:mannose-6-phosphate isomerase-like protein (cupin superfamily)
VDLLSLVRESPPAKPVWALLTQDLALNLVTLAPGEAIEWHVNAEVDVLLVGIEGEGTVRVDRHDLALGPGIALVVPKGARRAIAAGDGPFSYLSCHRARKPLGLIHPSVR